MTHAAVVSLKLTINTFLKSSPVSFTRTFLQLAYDEATTLQRVLESLNDSSKSNRESVKALEVQIRDCAYGLEDVLEFNESVEGELDSEVRREITSFAEQVKRLEVEFIQELSKQVDNSKDDDATDHQCFSSNNNIDSSVELLGYSSKLFNDIRDHLLRMMRPAELCFFSLLGEVGTGRTVVANILFDDLRKQKTQKDWMFDCIAWVKVGAECELNKVVIRILAQVDSLAAGELYEGLNDENLVCKQLNKVLKHRRYMIVLDDVHDMQLMEKLKSSCPDQRNGSLVLFTTSSDEISQLADIPFTFKRPRRFFEENMWFVLRGVCFHNESISAELEEAGIKIVQNCRSLAISLGKVFAFLLTAENTVEPWIKLADSACRY